MRRLSRSNTLFTKKIKPDSKISLFKDKKTEENNNENNFNNINNVNRIITLNDNIDIINNKNNNNIPKKQSSDKSNLISINYISEYRLQKKRKEHELEQEI